MTAIVLYVNGQRRAVDVESRRLLSDVLRDDCGLTGTHVGCEHGVCGACTVLVDGDPVRACLMFAVQAEGASIRTVEGIADYELHRLQQSFHDTHALQCGFCTPGFLMLGCWLLEHDPVPNDELVRDVLGSNVCRCTGYANIVTAVQHALTTAEGGVP